MLFLEDFMLCFYLARKPFTYQQLLVTSEANQAGWQLKKDLCESSRRSTMSQLCYLKSDKLLEDFLDFVTHIVPDRLFFEPNEAAAADFVDRFIAA